MEKDSITIRIEAESGTLGDSNHYRDHRQITIQATRGEVAKKIDEMCADIEANFES